MLTRIYQLTVTIVSVGKRKVHSNSELKVLGIHLPQAPLLAMPAVSPGWGASSLPTAPAPSPRGFHSPREEMMVI